MAGKLGKWTYSFTCWRRVRRRMSRCWSFGLRSLCLGSLVRRSVGFGRFGARLLSIYGSVSVQVAGKLAKWTYSFTCWWRVRRRMGTCRSLSLRSLSRRSLVCRSLVRRSLALRNLACGSVACRSLGWGVWLLSVYGSVSFQVAGN